MTLSARVSHCERVRQERAVQLPIDWAVRTKCKGKKQVMENEITVYGAYWCPDCRRSKTFLGEHQIPYNWVDVEQDAEAEQRVMRMNDGKRMIPTMVFGDGSFLVEPSNAELAAKLGLKTTASRSYYPHIVVGGGPAGLTAALYTAREGIDTLVIERAAFGGQAAGTERLDNLPGFPDSIAGIDFSNRLRDQAAKFGVELLQAQDVVGISSRDNYHTVVTGDGAEYASCALLVATGARYKRLNVPGENDYIGAGVHFCATCDGPFYRGKRVAVIGGGNSATEESLLLTKFASHVTILVRGSEFKASKIAQAKVMEHSDVDVMWNTEVRQFVGAKSKTDRLECREQCHRRRAEIARRRRICLYRPNSQLINCQCRRRRSSIPGGSSLPAMTCCTTAIARPVTESANPTCWKPASLASSRLETFAPAARSRSPSASGEGATAALLVREYLKTV